jgi:hypothetical protein
VATYHEIQNRDVIQITRADHAWFPALMVVTDARAHTVDALVYVPETPHISQHYRKVKLQYGDFEIVGQAGVGYEEVDPPEGVDEG